MYQTVKALHRLLASIILPFLLMYGISAVQMAHGTWFDTKPTIREWRLSLSPGVTDARVVAREISVRAPDVRGELTGVQTGASGMTFRVVRPGTVHELTYRQASGEIQVKTTVSGVVGMLNRLHHAAGLWHQPIAMKAWGLVVGVVSAMLLLVGASGVYMWFLRRQERLSGAVLLAANLLVVITLLGMMRAAGP
jgi:hypothetical protein